MLDEYMREFEKRNPNLRVFNAVMHLDEATPHLHIDFVPVARKTVRGLPLKNSMSGALREQGFSSTNRFQNEWVSWEEREQQEMTRILLAHGFSRDVKNDKHECTTIINITTAVKQFRLVPKKVNPNYIYTFENDVNIDRISRQLATLDEFGLTSREQIYAKADELKADNTAEGTEKLRRIKELIKVYEDIVDGNYIDNLVKSQNAVQKQSHKH